MIRIGHGYDAHRLTAGRKLILGGVDIPHVKGLDGHSDADVLTHAVCDAILGALALGDIGKHFPPSDSQYKNANSLYLLKQVMALLNNWTIGNIDTTIVAQAPKLAVYIPLMRENLAAALGTALENVNIKATTEEGMGFTGCGEGIAAHCVVCLLAAS